MRNLSGALQGALISCVFPCVAAFAQTPPAPPPILHGGQVVALYPPGSPFLNAGKAGEAEQNNMAKGVPGRIQSIVNIHNPSIEFHPADPGGVNSIILRHRSRAAEWGMDPRKIGRNLGNY